MAMLSTFRVGEHLFGVGVDVVQEVAKLNDLTPVPKASPNVAGLVNLRGQVLAVVDVRERLGYPRCAPGEEGAVHIVLRPSIGSVSLRVDAVEGFSEVGEDQFAERPETLVGAARELVTGAYRLDDRLLLVLDVHRTVTWE